MKAPNKVQCMGCRQGCAPMAPNAVQQQGVSLMEALVAVLILAFGVLGMLGLQLNLLAETRNSTQRAQAIRIIEDLSERVKSNPSRYAVLSAYVLPSWEAPAGMALPNCNTATCTADQLAAWDINAWRRNVPISLPGAQALTFLSQNETQPANRRQLGVMLAWRVNERATHAATVGFLTPFVVAEASADGPAIACPAHMICHLAYIQP